MSNFRKSTILVLSILTFCFFIVSCKNSESDNGNNKDKAITPEKNSPATNKNLSIDGFGEVKFNDGIIKTITNIKKMGVNSIVIFDKEVIDYSENELSKLLFDRENYFSSNPTDEYDINSAERSMKRCTEYMINSKAYCGIGTGGDIKAKPIMINGLPYSIFIRTDTNLGYPIANFDNADKYIIKNRKYADVTFISTSRIVGIQLFPIGELPKNEVQSMISLYKNKYSSIEKDENNYVDSNSNVINIRAADAVISYVFYGQSSEYKIYDQYKLDNTKKLYENKKDNKDSI